MFYAAEEIIPMGFKYLLKNTLFLHFLSCKSREKGDLDRDEF